MGNSAFLFSGQGAQIPGMGRDFYVRSPAAKKIFDTADTVLGRSVSALCFHGTPEELNLTCNTQPCMLAVDLAAWAAAEESGLSPAAAAGFSLGEYAALAAAGVLSIEDAFRIIQIRADAMQEAVPVGEGAMAAVMRLTPEEVQALCGEVDGYVIPANFNSPAQTVVSGETAALNKLLALAKERRVRAVKLPVSAPFHCKLMEPARRKLEEEFSTVEFHNAKFPVYMNVDGMSHRNAGEIKACVLAQTVSPVQWTGTIRNMMADGLGPIVELGVGKALTGFVKKIAPEARTINIEDMETLAQALEGARQTNVGQKLSGGA